MKKTASKKKNKRKTGELRREYRFNYREARPNRFAGHYKVGSRVVLLDPDVAEAFDTQESVNAALRAYCKQCRERVRNAPRKKSKERSAAADGR